MIVLGKELTLLTLGKGFRPVLKDFSEFIGFETTTLFKMMDNESSWWVCKLNIINCLNIF